MTRIGQRVPAFLGPSLEAQRASKAELRASEDLGAPPMGPTSRPVVRSDEKNVLPEVSAKIDLALAYARAGKPRLANKRLDEAVQLLEAKKSQSSQSSAGLHPGLWNPLGDTQSVLNQAKSAVAGLAKTTAVRPGAGETPRVVVLYGTSANPPTGDGGHAGIVRWGAKDLKIDLPDDQAPEKAFENLPADEVWVLPVYRHAFSTKRDLIDFSHRFEMAKLGFENLPELAGKIQVKDTERVVVESAFGEAEKNGTPLDQVKVGTIDIVKHLAAENPGTRFVLALGGDTCRDLLGGKWKQGDELLKMVQIAVVPRAGVDGVTGTDPNAPKLSDVSSTKVRASADLDFLKEVLHPDVLSYMMAHGLYAFAPKANEDS
ncbi:MAG: hypothetical protein HY791_00800 [Deltaproteobacteria bacterium]|nr:hypothetical protein [Deltaproteobacteria bacterium]